MLIGLAIVYLANPIFRFFERRLFFKLRPQGLRRTISLICTYLLLFLIIAFVLLMMIPELIDSIVTFLGKYNDHFSAAIRQINLHFTTINRFFERITGNAELLEYLDEAELREKAADLFMNLDRISSMILDYISKSNFQSIQGVIGGTISLIADIIFGLFVSIYLLASKEKRYAQIMKLRRALFSNKTNEHITRVCTIADRSFGGFLEGKIFDSLLIGILTYIVISIFGIPYPILIAAFIGIANIIPVIGLMIGAIPTSIVIFLSEPGKVIPFLIIILIIQQIDANIIAPKILGNNIGISSLCVVIAVSVMGRLWGVLGLLLGVPLFATVLELIDQIIVRELQKKGRPSGVATYYSGSAIVDPTKNAHLTADRSVQRFEKKALQLFNKQERQEKLNRKEKFMLVLYRLAHKYHILSEMTDEAHTRYAADQAAKDAGAEAEALLNTIRAERANAMAVAQADASAKTLEEHLPEERTL